MLRSQFSQCVENSVWLMKQLAASAFVHCLQTSSITIAASANTRQFLGSPHLKPPSGTYVASHNYISGASFAPFVASSSVVLKSATTVQVCERVAGNPQQHSLRGHYVCITYMHSLCVCRMQPLTTLQHIQQNYVKQDIQGFPYHLLVPFICPVGIPR